MKLVKTLKSEIDSSVNFIFEGNFPGYFEARFVSRRPEEYIIAYLSPQSGCEKRCRFCHLTATGQLAYKDATLEETLIQARTVLNFYNDLVMKSLHPKTKIIHFSYMARGNPLSTKTLHEQGDKVIEALNALAREFDLIPRVMISDIISSEMQNKELTDLFKTTQPNIYYSIYSLSEKFRKKWLPNALPVSVALQKLKTWQDHTNKIIRLHWAFIDGENDTPEDVMRIIEAVNAINLRVDVNIVRYNPFSEKYGKEPHINHIVSLSGLLREGLPQSKIKIVDRVAIDVYGSCGMFLPK